MFVKGGVECIYACLVKNSGRPKCLDGCSKEFSIEVEMPRKYWTVFLRLVRLMSPVISIISKCYTDFSLQVVFSVEENSRFSKVFFL